MTRPEVESNRINDMAQDDDENGDPDGTPDERQRYWCSVGCVVDVGRDPLSFAWRIDIGVPGPSGHVNSAESIAVGRGPVAGAITLALAEYIAHVRGLPVHGHAAPDERDDAYASAPWFPHG